MRADFGTEGSGWHGACNCQGLSREPPPAPPPWATVFRGPVSKGPTTQAREALVMPSPGRAGSTPAIRTARCRTRPDGPFSPTPGQTQKWEWCRVEGLAACCSRARTAKPDLSDPARGVVPRARGGERGLISRNAPPAGSAARVAGLETTVLKALERTAAARIVGFSTCRKRSPRFTSESLSSSSLNPCA
jgi:hypothetical protein